MVLLRGHGERAMMLKIDSNPNKLVHSVQFCLFSHMLVFLWITSTTNCTILFLEGFSSSNQSESWNWTWRKLWNLGCLKMREKLPKWKSLPLHVPDKAAASSSRQPNDLFWFLSWKKNLISTFLILLVNTVMIFGNIHKPCGFKTGDMFTYKFTINL